MKEARICRNCAYYDGNALKHWCIYWKLEVGALARTQGCEKFISMKEILEKMPIMDENDIREILREDD